METADLSNSNDVVHPEVRAHINSLVSAVSRGFPPPKPQAMRPC